MRAVLDTNVLVSGTFWGGDSFRILQLVDKEKITIILSKAILGEYDEIVHRDEILEKTAYDAERIAAVLKIVQKATLVEPSKRLKLVKDDPDDDKILDAAVEGKAKYIVSSDNHLLKLKEYKNIKILTPKDFVELAK